MNLEERVNRMEDVIVLLKDLIVRHEERLDTFDVDFERSRKDFEFKMNALIDSQIKNEADLVELKQSTIELKEASIELKEASIALREASHSQLTRIERLEQV